MLPLAFPPFCSVVICRPLISERKAAGMSSSENTNSAFSDHDILAAWIERYYVIFNSIIARIFSHVNGH